MAAAEVHDPPATASGVSTASAVGPGSESGARSSPPASSRSRAARGRVSVTTLGRFEVESGASLSELSVAYRHDGPAAPAPQVLVVHALTGSADAAGDWWAPLIGPGRALDTDRIGVLSANLLGGRYGTTGPTSIDSTTGLPYGARFPAITVRDQARAQWALLDAIGIEELSLVVGGSLGGMVALEVALERPERVATVMPIAAPAATGPLAIAWNGLQLEMIERLGDAGLDLARRLAMTTYRSAVDFGTRFGRRVELDGRYAVTSYLEHQGRKLLDRFDTETYAVLVRAMDVHDIGRDRGGSWHALRRLATGGTRLTGVGIGTDILYGPEQVTELVRLAETADVEASYREIRSGKGHDAFLVEWAQLSALLREALAIG